MESHLYYLFEPEVAGSWGSQTVADVSVHPPKVSTLDYQFEGWLGDYILELFPCFIIESVLAKRLLSTGLTGISTEDVIISESEDFRERSPSIKLPDFKLLKVTGKAGRDDLGINQDNILVVSATFIETIPQEVRANADIEVLRNNQQI